MSQDWRCILLLSLSCLVLSSWAAAVQTSSENNDLYLFQKSNKMSSDHQIPAANDVSHEISKTNSLWTDCSKSSDPMEIYTINISPTPLQRGNKAYAAMTAELKQAINGGKISVVIRYGNSMTILRKQYNLCNFISQNGLSCPLEAGTVNFTYSIDIPSSAPSGLYTGSIVAIDENSEEITCVSLNLNLGA